VFGEVMNKLVSLSMLAATLVLLLATAVPAAADNTMMVQPDGRVVLGGSAKTGGAALVRYLPDGSLDPSFGKGGIAIDRRLGSYSAIYLQPDGRTLTASPRRGAPLDPSIGRYLANGSPDPSFGAGGLTYDPAAGDLGGVPTTILAEPSGRVLVATNVNGGKYKPTTSAAVSAFSPTGQFQGIRLSLFDPSLVASNSINDILPGSGFAVGSRPSGGDPVSERQLLLRIQEGTPAGYDPGLGEGQGLVRGREGQAQAVAAGPAGTLVVVGASAPPNLPASQGTVSRYDANGVLDPSFGSGGNADVAIPNGYGVSLRAVAVAADGSVVVVGRANVNGSPNCAGCATAVVARLTPDGKLDPSFGPGGVILLGPTSFGDRVPSMYGQDLALLTDGSILVSGEVAGESRAFALARLTPDGQLDTSFGNGGVVTTFTCKGDPREKIQRGCFTGPRVGFRVKGLLSARPSLRLKVRPDPRGARIDAVRLYLPEELRLNRERVELRRGFMSRYDADATPVVTATKIRFERLDGARWLSMSLWKGALRPVKRLRPGQKLTFKVAIDFNTEGEGTQTVVLHRRALGSPP